MSALRSVLFLLFKVAAWTLMVYWGATLAAMDAIPLHWHGALVFAAAVGWLLGVRAIGRNHLRDAQH